AKSLALANQRITGRMMNSAFSSWRGFGWSFRSSGLWFYNPLSTCYTFLPYGYGWGSPYGNSYTNSIYYHPQISARPNPGGWVTPSTGSGPIGPGGSTPTRTTPTYPAPTVGSTPSMSPPEPRMPRSGPDDRGVRVPNKSLPDVP